MALGLDTTDTNGPKRTFAQALDAAAQLPQSGHCSRCAAFDGLEVRNADFAAVEFSKLGDRFSNIKRMPRGKLKFLSAIECIEGLQQMLTDEKSEFRQITILLSVQRERPAALPKKGF